MQGDNQDYQTCIVSIEKLIAKIKPPTSSSLKSFMAALYTADDENPLRFSGKIGLLQLDIDRALKVHFLRLYDIESLHLLMEIELFYGFGENFRQVEGNEKLYVFDCLSDGIIGFLFKNPTEACIMASKIRSVAPANQQFRDLQKEKIRQQIQQKKKTSFLGKIKNKFLHKEQAPVHKESEIIAVEKSKSISMDSAGNFNLENIPPEWQEIFDTMGLQQQDLKSQEVMQIIFDQVILHQAKKAAEADPEHFSEHLELIQEETQDDTEHRQSDLYSETERLDVDNLLPEPPIPPPLPTSPAFTDINPRVSMSRANLMQEIRSRKIVLKPVKTTGEVVELDASCMNKQERMDLAEHLRLKLQRRKVALQRRKASSDESESD